MLMNQQVDGKNIEKRMEKKGKDTIIRMKRKKLECRGELLLRCAIDS